MGFWDQIRDRFTSRPAGPVEPLSASVFNAGAAEAFGPRLEEIGLEAMARRKWGDPGERPIRRLFELQPLKGASYTPLWGFSFDFVPHLTGRGEIRWHRTLKNTRFDLACRPIDHEPSDARRREWYTTLFLAPERLGADLRRLADLAIPEATRWWATVRNEDDLPAAFEARRSLPAIGIPFESYTQEYLAFAFVLARAGDSRAGGVLEECMTALETPEPSRKRLEQLMRERAIEQAIAADKARPRR